MRTTRAFLFNSPRFPARFRTFSSRAREHHDRGDARTGPRTPSSESMALADRA